MKSVASVVLGLFVAILLTSEITASQTGVVTVEIIGLKSDAGNAHIALIKDKTSFNSEDAEPFMRAAAKIENGASSWTFNNVPYGVYAVKFFHDEDGSGKLTYGIFGIPKEEYGFSNNIRSKNFDTAKFTLDSSNVIITIKAR